jgi:hypothetical protein
VDSAMTRHCGVVMNEAKPPASRMVEACLVWQGERHHLCGGNGASGAL